MEKVVRRSTAPGGTISATVPVVGRSSPPPLPIEPAISTLSLDTGSEGAPSLGVTRYQ
jgi:hypothetical protein